MEWPYYPCGEVKLFGALIMSFPCHSLESANSYLAAELCFPSLQFGVSSIHIAIITEKEKVFAVINFLLCLNV